jgi:hypothetical protein
VTWSAECWVPIFLTLIPTGSYLWAFSTRFSIAYVPRQVVMVQGGLGGITGINRCDSVHSAWPGLPWDRAHARPRPLCDRVCANALPGLVRHVIVPSPAALRQSAGQPPARPSPPCDRVQTNTSPRLFWHAVVTGMARPAMEHMPTLRPTLCAMATVLIFIVFNTFISFNSVYSE